MKYITGPQKMTADLENKTKGAFLFHKLQFIIQYE